MSRRNIHGSTFHHCSVGSECRHVVVIDGCFMKCHGRILKSLVPEERLLQFDALTIHRKYSSIMDSDEVPEEERRETARQVAETILNHLKRGTISAGASDAAVCCRETACTS